MKTNANAFSRIGMLFLTVLSSAAQTGASFEVIKTFSGEGSPRSQLLQGVDGALYGTTSSSVSTVFKLNPDGTGYQVILNFGSGVILSALIDGNDGYFYGGGSRGVFRLRPDGTELAFLDHGGTVGHLAQAIDGTLFGATQGGGSSGMGTVFRVNPDGTGFAVLKSFTGLDGRAPLAGPILANDGFLYGTTASGGAINRGTVFRLATDGTGFEMLTSFDSLGNANSPRAELTQANDGALYGTTINGVLFKLNTDGTGYTEIAQIDSMRSRIMQASDGRLYGTTLLGTSPSAYGSVFSLNMDGSGFVELWSFSTLDGDGFLPFSGVIQASDGFIYGTISQLGTSSSGAVFRLNPDEDGDGFSVGADNCPFAPNPGQGDADADGIGDECDPRFDFQLRSFAVFGEEFVRLRDGAIIHTGNVGANSSIPDPNGGEDDQEEVEIGERSKLLEAGSCVVGDTVRLRANAQVHNLFFNELRSSNADILGARAAPYDTPVLSLPLLPEINPGIEDITVPRNLTALLAPGSYRNMRVEQKGELVLSAGVYHFASLDLRDQARMLLTGPVEIRVKNEIDTDSNAFIGPDPAATELLPRQIVFYIEGADDKGRPHPGEEELAQTAVQFGPRNTVLANIFAPNGTVLLRASTEGIGAFVGKQVQLGRGVELRLDSAF